MAKGKKKAAKKKAPQKKAAPKKKAAKKAVKKAAKKVAKKAAKKTPPGPPYWEVVGAKGFKFVPLDRELVATSSAFCPICNWSAGPFNTCGEAQSAADRHNNSFNPKHKAAPICPE
jgi:hypothetical protein